MIVIIDYKTGNTGSVSSKLKMLGYAPVISSDIAAIKKATRIILPGIGSFERAIRNLTELNLVDVLNEKVMTEQVPLLGICLGMQLISRQSEEGNCPGLGWIDAATVRFRVNDTLKYKIPHTGWNHLRVTKDSLLMKGITESSEFYFIHSYHLSDVRPEIILSETKFNYQFPSAIEQQNIFGVQFHPEKSHEAGARLLKNFINL